MAKRKKPEEPDVRIDAAARAAQWRAAGLQNDGAKSPPSPERLAHEQEIAERQQRWKDSGLASNPKVLKHVPTTADYSPFAGDKSLFGRYRHWLWCLQNRAWHERSVWPLRVVALMVAGYWFYLAISAIIHGDRGAAVMLMIALPIPLSLFMVAFFLKLK